MPRQVKVDGVVHQFPDDATDDEIQQALGGSAASVTPPNSGAPPLPPSSLPPLNSQWDATKFTASQASSGAFDTLKGMVQSVIPKSAEDVAIGPAGMIAKGMINQGIDLAKMVPQVPGAIRDIAASPSPLAALATTAPYAGGQGAMQVALAVAGKMATKAPVPMEPEQAMNLIRKGVLPKDPDFMPNLKKNLDTLKAAPEIGGKAQMADFLEKSGTAHRELYENLLKPNERATVSTAQIKNYAGDTMGDEAKSATLRQLDNRLNVINNTIRDAKAGASGGPLSTEGIAPLKAEARAIRQVLYPQLQRLTGVDPAPIHAKMGQLNDLARQVRDSEIARYNQVNRPIDAPTTTKAGLVARGVGTAQRKVFGDPQDVAIRKAFQGLRWQK